MFIELLALAGFLLRNQRVQDEEQGEVGTTDTLAPDPIERETLTLTDYLPTSKRKAPASEARS